jgi:hypothetical protein
MDATDWRTALRGAAHGPEPAPSDRGGPAVASRALRVCAALLPRVVLGVMLAGPAAAQDADRGQMKGLDDQVQEIKSDVLGIAAELSLLEEKLLYPSGTQVALFVALAPNDPLRLDAIRVNIGGQLVAHYIYSFKELDALRRGGVQRLYVGNLPTGEHLVEVQVDGKQEGGADFSRTEQFRFTKGVEPKLLGLTVAGPASGQPPLALGDW